MTGGGLEPSRATCPGCGRELGRGMNFCPGCGRQLTEAAPWVKEAPRPSIAQGALHFTAPAHAQSPPFMPPYVMYPPQLSSRRAGAIASAVFSLVSASFAFIGGLIYILQGLGSENLWVLMGALCFLAFALAILGTIGIARRTWRFVSLLADLALLGLGLFVFLDQIFVGIVVLAMALVAIILLLASWGQFGELHPWGPPFPYPGPPGGAWPPPAGRDGGPVEEYVGEE